MDASGLPMRPWKLRLAVLRQTSPTARSASAPPTATSTGAWATPRRPSIWARRPLRPPPPLVIDRARRYTATISTDQGDIVIELFADKAPTTVNNFVFLAREGFYDGVTFHRVIKGFMAQG